MLVWSKRYRKFIGMCDRIQVFGRCLFMPIKTVSGLYTTIGFRWGCLNDGWYVIAHGYRDAELLPGFARL